MLLDTGQAVKGRARTGVPPKTAENLSSHEKAIAHGPVPVTQDRRAGRSHRQRPAVYPAGRSGSKYYNLLFPAFFASAHLALARAANLALPAAVNFFLGS